MKLRNGFRARMRCICAFQVEVVSPLGVGAHADQDELGVVDIEQANVLARKAAIAKRLSVLCEPTGNARAFRSVRKPPHNNAAHESRN